MDSKRQERISKLLQKDLGMIFQTEMQSLAKGAMVTVTKVNITPDLGVAKIYLSLFATKDKDAALKNIRAHTSEIRRNLGNKVRHQLRIIPNLSFYIDDSLDYIDNIDTLLKS